MAQLKRGQRTYRKHEAAPNPDTHMRAVRDEGNMQGTPDSLFDQFTVLELSTFRNAVALENHVHLVLSHTREAHNPKRSPQSRPVHEARDPGVWGHNNSGLVSHEAGSMLDELPRALTPA